MGTLGIAIIPGRDWTLSISPLIEVGRLTKRCTLIADKKKTEEDIF